MKKKILIIILTFTILYVAIANLTAATRVETAQFYEGSYLSPAIYVAKKARDGYGTFAQEKFIRKSDGTPVYCVEPFVKMQSNVDYTGYVDDVSEFIQSVTYTKDTFTKAQWEKATLIANYGYGYGSHTADKWYAITQVMIWKAVYNGISIGFCNSFSDAQNFNYNTNLYKAEQEEINKLVSEHYIVPSFNIDGNLIVGQQREFEDSNHVLGKYEISGYTNCTARKSGNTLIITPTGTGEVSVTLTKGDANAKKPTLYVKEGAQNLMMAGNVSVTSTVSARAVGGRITINKVDAETTAVQGDATFEGAIYGIYSDGGSEVGRVTLGADGRGLTDYLEPGTYTIREIQPSRGYLLSNASYTATISLDNLNPSVEVSETVIKGGIEIQKRLDGTDYDSEINLQGVQFKVTLKSDRSKVYYTNTSGSDGICRIDNLPYGTYEVEESIVPIESLKLANFDVKIDTNNKTYEYTKVDKSKKVKLKLRKVDIDRLEDESPDFTQGDAKLEGAVYEVFRDPQCTQLVTTITVDHKDDEGYWCAETGTLRTATYYAKEKKAPVGYLRDENVYTFEGNVQTQTVEIEPKVLTSAETVSRGSLKIVKYDNENLSGTEKSLAEGAVLRLTLKSDETKFYEVTISDVGYAEFVDERAREKYYPYTIPYGEYVITEIKGSNSGAHTHYFSKPEDVTITKQGQREFRILEEEPVQMYLTLRKLDKDTDKSVSIAGARFKIWNMKKSEWVSIDGTDEFVTGEDGTITLSEKLNAGEYILYEVESPDGYYLQDELRLPENEEDIGVKEKGGKYVLIDKAAMGVEGDATGPVTDLYYIVDLPNEPLKGSLQIFKTGEMLTDVTIETTEYGDKYTPKYEERGLPGVTYEIYAAEDIVSPDKSQTYVTQGTKVDTITTNDEGIATSKELYLGEYEIREVVTPEGYLTDTSIDNVVLTNENKKVKVEITQKALGDIRQKLYIGVNKKFADIDFSKNETLEQKSIFGIYSNQDIANVEGNVIITKDTLLDLVEINGNTDSASSNIDLPKGEYYAKEVYVSYPYTLNENIIPITINYPNNVDETSITNTEEITNEYDSGNIKLLKLSSSIVNDVILTGSKLDLSTLDDRQKEIISKVAGMTDEEIRRYFEDENIVFIPGVQYGIYFDEECTQPLYIKNEEGNFEEAKIITDDMGIISITGIPLGKYYIKEDIVPDEYILSEDVVEVNLTPEYKSETLYRALINNSIIGPTLSKLDIFTGDAVPNCKFEIRDDEDNVLVTLTTDENGEGYIPFDLLEDGRTYKYVELDAPDIYKEDGKLYELNTEPKEFVARFSSDDDYGIIFDEKTVVENYRPTSDVEFTKTDFLDGKPIPNCKFELRSLETDYVVEGVTDENGVYVFKNIPYGRYTYKELEAPGYIVDDTPHEIEINTQSTQIKVRDDKAPFTGDIDVLSVILLALISVLGIFYVYKRRQMQE